MEDQELKSFYVYELRDPLDDSVFYVGKGQDRRAESHIREALRQEPSKTDRNENKLSMVRIIERRTDPTVNSVKIVVVGRYDSDDRAFAVESTLIKWVYGKENLTNINNGHHAATIRERDNYNDIPGIDIPKSRGSYGSGVDDAKEQNDKYKVVEKLEELKRILKQNYPSWNISEITPAVTDKSFYVQYNDYVKFQCLLRANEKDSLIVNIR